MRKKGSKLLLGMSVWALQTLGCDRPGASERDPKASAPRAAEATKVTVLSALHEASQLHVRTSQLAADRAEAPEVRRYAGILLHDDSDIDSRLVSAAERESIDLVPLGEPVSTALRTAGDRLERRLVGSRGREFDAAYLAPQVVSHEYVMGLVEQAETTSPGRELATILADLHKQANAHLVEAKRLSGSLAYQPAVGVGLSDREAEAPSKKDGGALGPEKAVSRVGGKDAGE